jgi:glutamate synthase domain-containing protein 2
MSEYTFETYGTAQFWLEDWYTIEDLEQLVKDLKAVKERQDRALVQSMKESGVIKWKDQ